jgi:tRNA (guanine-N7-)-methyltransferase
MKNKLKKFAELKEFSNVIQPKFEEVFDNEHDYKGSWNNFFPDQKPLILELGCGKGEYTVNLALKNPTCNYIGIDIKGARIWKGAKMAIEEELSNVAFIRTNVELTPALFGKNEISEIWIPFPDPQEKKTRIKKRLVSSRFLNIYKSFLTDNGIVHLKTDNAVLYQYALDILGFNGVEVLVSTGDLYGSGQADDVLSIQTFYEKQFLEQGKKICYLKFRLLHDKEYKEPPEE